MELRERIRDLKFEIEMHGAQKLDLLACLSLKMPDKSTFFCELWLQKTCAEGAILNLIKFDHAIPKPAGAMGEAP